uniref:Uncharacterized protein LOC111100127 n=1 Tax=Crassostrea virginica TaxID=6565 RepID=A0A8B8A8G8_CRAVI|nr:uncharacterized protein LOC111100127 [Crassostrea virginica]
MTAWESDNTPVFKSPDDFDSIEIKTRSCGDVGQRPYCWLGDSPSQCTTPQENRPCLWKSTIVYASHDFGSETCIDIPHDCDNRNFFQFGLKAKCNNRNGCNTRDPIIESTWKKGITFFRFRVRVEPGRCQYDSGSYSDDPADGSS